jgi:hypothetical protein
MRYCNPWSVNAKTTEVTYRQGQATRFGMDRCETSFNVSAVHDVPEPLAAQACPRVSLPNMSWNYLRGRCVKWRVTCRHEHGWDISTLELLHRSHRCDEDPFWMS